jgi:hypothetical protein
VAPPLAICDSEITDAGATAGVAVSIACTTYGPPAGTVHVLLYVLVPPAGDAIRTV